MNEGELSSGQNDSTMSASGRPIFGGTNDAVNDAAANASTPIMSVPDTDTPTTPRASAATPIMSGSSPSTPQFFNDAMAAMTPAPEPARKSKRGLIIGIIIAAIALLVVGGIILAIFLGQSDRPRAISSADQAKFNSFANYILSGNESTERIPEYEFTQYRIMDIYLSENSSEISTFFDHAYELWNAFIATYTDADKELPPLVEAYQDDLDAARYAMLTADIDYRQIISNYVAGGKTSAEAYVTKYFNSLGASEDLVIHERRQAMATNYVDMLEIYAANNCIAGETVDAACVEAIVDQQLNNWYAAQEKLYWDVSDSITTQENNVITRLWDVDKLIHGEPDE
ncbi:hypothetical protein IJ102_00740 [Candidatus Saccharibacteria bacterium]|nr:hypothetical protein [Candidatus Saccharibacteria bacterium]